MSEQQEQRNQQNGMATASGNMRDTASHDPFFMLPRGHMLVQQGFGRHHPNSQSSWDMAGGLHLPSLRHNSGYKQTQFTGNMNLSSSLLDSVGLNHNRPVGNITGPGKQNIPGHSSVPMHLPGGNLPARTLTEPPGAGFYRPRTVAKPKDGPGKRALQRPQTQPHHGTFAYLQAKA